jgi:MoaA/NifB/PqqE/SkfB family radical SAM enzyme
MTLSEISALADSIGPLLQVTLTGGSPELRRDLSDIVRYFSEKCHPVNMTICMNGYHSETIIEHVKQILSKCPDQAITIAISLDGLEEEHDSIRGMPGLFERIKKTFSGLSALKSTNPRLSLECGICISEFNASTAFDTASWAWKNLPIDYLKPILVRGSPRQNQALGKKCIKVYQQLTSYEESTIQLRTKQAKSLFGVSVNAKEIVQRRLISAISEGGQLLFPCSAARQTAVIQADGIIKGCELRNEILGNLRGIDMNFKNLWYSKQASDFRSHINTENCSCYHHCFLAPGIYKSRFFWQTFTKLLWLNLRNKIGIYACEEKRRQA